MPGNEKNFEGRYAEVSRRTSETEVQVAIHLDGTGKGQIDTPVGFFNHMLELMAFHAGFDLKIQASGDTHVDDHHLVEDVGLALGEVFKQALGNKAGIQRYADITIPMDEALVLLAVDISGRPHLSYDVSYLTERVGQLDVLLVEEFLKSLTNEGKITLHVRKLAGRDTHHIVEAIFKGLGRILNTATRTEAHRPVPSTKGTLS